MAKQNPRGYQTQEAKLFEIIVWKIALNDNWEFYKDMNRSDNFLWENIPVHTYVYTHICMYIKNISVHHPITECGQACAAQVLIELKRSK